ncbi:uncharacterized protein [Temnothorax longispinosus]|uniref:uncharacterized protein isoform X3 n=1 Tax=Temnothorax longispinosus TaxID=300112 RepID=UPI003A99B5FF
MICLKTQHFNVNRILLLAVGLWPYQRSRVVELQLILFLGILITFIIFQFTTFLTSKCTPEHILEVISSTFFITCFVILYNSFWINANTIRSTLDRLQDVCNELRDENEIAILKKYGSKAKRYTTAIIPINIGAVSMMATGTIFIAYLQHICGMFGIASYRIEQAINILQKDILKSENMVYKEITYAVDIHRKAMEFTDFLISNFERSFFFLIVIGVTCASINLFQLASYSDGIEKLVIPILKLIFLYVFLFLSNYVAQEATNHNECVFATVYDVQWYTAPLHIQKIILFLLQRGTKPFHINLGGIFVASLESAATVFSATISYFTVLYSTREN